MKYDIIYKTSTSFVVEIKNNGYFSSEHEHEIYVNGSLAEKSDRNVASVFGLAPATSYDVELMYGGETERFTVTTNDEYVTLNVKDFGAKGLAYLSINEDGTYKSSFAKFMAEEELDALVREMEGKPGDLLLFAADKNKVVWDVLGSLRLELAQQMELLDKNRYQFLWVTEFPLLEYNDELGRYQAMHHPFTMPVEEDLPYLESDPGRVRARAYDIVLNGTELGGGSVRIHQNDIQEKMFEALGFTKESAYSQFGFLLNAFKYGVPPHAGLAYGLDRLIMLMAKEDSIRDVIAFPKVKDASCLMTEAPGSVDPSQLEELGIGILESGEE